MTREQEMIAFEQRFFAIAEVIRINNPEKYADLGKKAPFWAPEIRPLKLSAWVNENYPLDPENPETLIVYSLLTNRPMNELANQMREDLRYIKRR